MQWFSQAFAFYKLVLATTKASKEQREAYHQELTNLAASARSLYRITDFISVWEKYDVFDIQHIIPTLLNYIGTQHWDLYDALHHWSSNCRESYVLNKSEEKAEEEIIWYYLKKRNTITLREYSRAVSSLHGQNNSPIMNALNEHLLQTIEQLLKSYEEGEITNEHELLFELAQFKAYARLPDEQIRKIIEQFGIEIYIHVYPLNGIDLTVILNKPQYSVFDVASVVALMQANQNGISAQLMKQLIAKSDPEAREFLRSHLFMDVDSTDTKKVFFILDEEMQPMNIDLDRIPFPKEMKIMSVEGISDHPSHKEEKEKWRQIFRDFKVVPVSEMSFHP